MPNGGQYPHKVSVVSSTLTFTTMISLQAEDWFTIKGRGKVATVVAPKDQLHVGDLVEIDGKQYKLVGIEYVCRMISSLPQKLGLLVRDEITT